MMSKTFRHAAPNCLAERQAPFTPGCKQLQITFAKALVMLDTNKKIPKRGAHLPADSSGAICKNAVSTKRQGWSILLFRDVISRKTFQKTVALINLGSLSTDPT
jgi:hypothetical protein